MPTARVLGEHHFCVDCCEKLEMNPTAISTLFDTASASLQGALKQHESDKIALGRYLKELEDKVGVVCCGLASVVADSQADTIDKRVGSELV